MSSFAKSGAEPTKTSATVNLYKEMVGDRGAVRLEWGSRTYGIRLKTNGSQSRLTIQAVAVEGFGASLSDIKISFKAPDAYGFEGNTISRRGKTAKDGDMIWVTVSSWLPFGSPLVYLRTTYLALDQNGVWR